MQKDIMNSLEMYFQDQKEKGFVIMSKEEKRGPVKRGPGLKPFKIALSFIVAGFILSGCTYDNSHDEYKENEKEFQAQNFNNDYTRYEMFKTGHNNEGMLFFVPDAGEMNTVFITYEDAEKWKIRDIRPGAKIAGIFDQWELVDAWEVVRGE